MVLLQIYRKNVNDPIGVRVEAEYASGVLIAWHHKRAGDTNQNDVLVIDRKLSIVVDAIDAIEIVED